MSTEGLEEALRRAQAAWPGVDFPGDDFARILRARLEGGADLDALHVEDLYLASACARGQPAAIAELQRRYLSKLAGYLAHLRLADSALDEVRQVLGEKLFVGRGGAAPKIAEYSGRGALDGWIRIAAIRTALSLARRQKHELPLDENSPPALAPSPDPELEFIKDRYRGDFEAAFRSAVGELSPRDRNVLRLRFLDGLGIGEIGVACGVHRTTAARWLADAQAAVLEGTRRILRERLRLSAGESESLMGLVQSRVEVTIHNLLKRTAG